MSVEPNILLRCPSNLDQLTLGDWSRFYIEYGQKLDKQYTELMGQPDTIFRQLDEVSLQVERMYCYAAFFTNQPLRRVKKLYKIGDVSQAHNECFATMFDGANEIELVHEFEWNGETWVLPTVELLPNSAMTFGEFIDSKTVVQDVQQQQQTRWELLHQVAAIFLRRKGEAYTDAFIFTGSERLELFNKLPMRIALTVGEWFDRFNMFLEASFPIFHKSDIKGGMNMKQHFEQWGWINFLKTIAQTKVFDVVSYNVNSIECARRAPCFDVLIYASEDKSYNEAQYFDMEEEHRKNKRNH